MPREWIGVLSAVALVLIPAALAALRGWQIARKRSSEVRRASA